MNRAKKVILGWALILGMVGYTLLLGVRDVYLWARDR